MGHLVDTYYLLASLADWLVVVAYFITAISLIYLWLVKKFSSVVGPLWPLAILFMCRAIMRIIQLTDATNNTICIVGIVASALTMILILPFPYLIIKSLYLPKFSQLQTLNAELAKSKSQLDSILDNTPAFVFMKSAYDWKYLYINETFERDWGIAPCDIIDKTDFDLFHMNIASVLRSHDEVVKYTNQPITFEEKLERNGIEHVYMVSKFPIINGGGLPYAICGIAIDITDRKHAEEDLRNTIIGMQEQISALQNLVNTQADAVTDNSDVVILDVISSLRRMADEHRTATTI